MVILTMTNCPAGLRGDLSRWLQEVNTGVYIGRLSARVREALWKRVCENIRDGQATMIYSASNVQGYEILVHNTAWQPKDYDGITLMYRPAHADSFNLKAGFSKEAKYQKARMFSQQVKSKKTDILDYVILDLETTGLDAEKDRMIEIGALKVIGGVVVDRYQCLVIQEKPIPADIEKLTGITYEMTTKEGVEEKEAVEKLLKMIDSYVVLGYHVQFDLDFIKETCIRLNIENTICRSKDVLSMARRKIENIDNYRLRTVARFLGIDVVDQHRALRDCEIVYRIYGKLNEI